MIQSTQSTQSTQSILASTSTRRKELLAQLSFSQPDFSFRALPADIDGSNQFGESPQNFVVRLVVEKQQVGLALFNADVSLANTLSTTFVWGQTPQSYQVIKYYVIQHMKPMPLRHYLNCSVICIQL